MTQNQEFQAEVGQVIQAESVTQIHHDASRVLTTQERKELNDRVKQFEEEYGEPGWKTWRFLHRTIGIENIEAMRLDRRDSAHAILDLMIERAALQNSCSQQQNHDEDSAGQLAALLMQNSTLTAQLKESKGLRAHLERLLEATTKQEKELQSRVDELRLEADEFRFEADKSEKLIARAVQQCRQLDGALLHAKKRGNRFLALFLLCGSAAALGVAAIYYLATRLHAAEAQLNICAFEGKAYALGSVIDGTPDRECIRTNDGRAIWKAVPEKPRRSK
jgi:chromosome segregation ATPase